MKGRGEGSGWLVWVDYGRGYGCGQGNCAGARMKGDHDFVMGCAKRITRLGHLDGCGFAASAPRGMAVRGVPRVALYMDGGEAGAYRPPPIGAPHPDLAASPLRIALPRFARGPHAKERALEVSP